MSTNPPALADIVLQKIITWTNRRVRDLVVEVGTDGVILRGRAASFHVKQLAMHGAREVLPTVPLRNAIVVESR